MSAAAEFGVYIHWPFCKSKCPYCDFNSHVRDGVDQPRWRRALLADLDRAADETGTTFRENARIKAEAAANATGLPAFSDDSGLEVEALGGAPGIHSARWAGTHRDFGAAMERIERELAAAATSRAGRRARFVSALCVAWPDRHREEFEADVAGTLVWPPRGSHGFGYDPMFQPDGFALTFGEMSAEQKHGLPPRGQGLSHRARAFRKLAAACLERR